MRPTLHPSLVNGRSGDPALFVEMLHRRGALLFDMGDLGALSARDLLRIDHVFVSHMHMDHFIGFDALLRVSVGREKVIRMLGPPGFCARVHHKLQAYEWDLVERYDTELVFEVQEAGEEPRAARFRFRNRFAFEKAAAAEPRVDGLELRVAVLEHHGPCLGFAVSEPAHVNVWRNRLEERGLAPGPWLQALKQAVLGGSTDERPIGLPDGGEAPLGELRSLVSISQGQKIAYVTDVADTSANREAIAELARGADIFFIESRFAAADAEQARQRAHLTTRAAGEIARAAGVRRVEPFHFSPRYEGEEERMMGEVFAAFETDQASAD